MHATPKLYLVWFSTTVHAYPDRDEPGVSDYRLVEADSEDEARAKLARAVEVHDPYARTERIERCSMHEVIR